MTNTNSDVDYEEMILNVAANIIKKRRGEQQQLIKVRKPKVMTKPRWRVTMYDYPTILLPEGVTRKAIHVKEFVTRNDIINSYSFITSGNFNNWVVSNRSGVAEFFDNFTIEKI